MLVIVPFVSVFVVMSMALRMLAVHLLDWMIVSVATLCRIGDGRSFVFHGSLWT